MIERSRILTEMNIAIAIAIAIMNVDTDMNCIHTRLPTKPKNDKVFDTRSGSSLLRKVINLLRIPRSERNEIPSGGTAICKKGKGMSNININNIDCDVDVEWSIMKKSEQKVRVSDKKCSFSRSSIAFSC
jgi:hypothetical protein